MYKRASVFCVAVWTAESALAGPFSIPVSTDGYYVSPSNGTPTARSNPDGFPDVFDAVNRLIGSTFMDNRGIDDRLVESDEIWNDLNGVILAIGLTASYGNALGYYTVPGGSATHDLLGPYSGYEFLGDGTKQDPYPATTTGPTGGPFGFYLKSKHGNGSTSTFFSQPSRDTEPGQLDHLMTFALPELAGKKVWIYRDDDHDGDLDHGEKASRMEYTFVDPFLVTWEDLDAGNGVLGDEDYDDMMFVVDTLAENTVPEPGTMFLLGAGLAGLAGARARSKTGREKHGFK